VKLEIAVESCQDRGGGGRPSRGAKRSRRMSDLEAKLDELRRELSSSSSNGGISVFPHAVLTSEQISLLSRQKPTTEGEVRCFATYFPCVFAIAESGEVK
jgi:ATP-dependent DNA helicase Q1